MNVEWEGKVRYREGRGLDWIGRFERSGGGVL